MNKGKSVVIIFIIIVVAGISASGYFYFRYQRAQQEIQAIKSDPNILRQVAQQEIKKIVEEVERLIALPEDEDPTVATITDIEKLKDQVFFQKAKNGDRVLIYTNARKAILYDPAAKKIIDVAPVNIGTPSAQQAIKIVLKNGTDTAGLTNKVEPDIKKSLVNANIVAKENASKTDYEKSIVVALTEEAKDEAEKLARDLNIDTGDLPQAESRPEGVDIVVILGRDKI